MKNNGALLFWLVTALFSVALDSPALAQDQAPDNEASSTMNIGERYAEAEAYRKGIGGVIDLRRALELHESLAKLGHVNSLRRMADIYLKLNRGEEALDALELAVSRGSMAAKVKLAEGHARGLFGDRSDAGLGIARLVELRRELGSDGARYALANAYSNGYGTEPDHKTALALYRELAAEGHANSIKRLGDYFAEGAHVPRDLTAAMRAYRAAIEAGSTSAPQALVRAQVAANQMEAAAQTLDDAVSVGVPGMAYLRAVYNAEERLGALSDRRAGLEELERLSNAGDVRAAAKALKQVEKIPSAFGSAEIQAWVALLENAAAFGDGRATEALARAYRTLEQIVPGARAKHRRLVAELSHQMRPRYRVTETLHAIYTESGAAALRTEMVRLVTEADVDGYYHGALELRKIDKNAFTHLLQAEMRRQGRYSGRVNGLFTGATIRAVLRFCGSRGDRRLCERGPLKSDPAKFIMRELATVRHAKGERDLQPSLVAAAPEMAPAHRLALDKPYVQVGLFGSVNRAERIAAQLVRAGLEAHIGPMVWRGKRYRRVTVGPAATDAERLAFMKEVEEMGFTDAFPVAEVRSVAARPKPNPVAARSAWTPRTQSVPKTTPRTQLPPARVRGRPDSSRVVGVFSTGRESWILVQNAGGDIVEVQPGQEINGTRVTSIGGNAVRMRGRGRTVVLRAGDTIRSR